MNKYIHIYFKYLMIFCDVTEASAVVWGGVDCLRCSGSVGCRLSKSSKSWLSWLPALNLQSLRSTFPLSSSADKSLPRVGLRWPSKILKLDLNFICVHWLRLGHTLDISFSEKVSCDCKECDREPVSGLNQTEYGSIQPTGRIFVAVNALTWGKKKKRWD